MEKNILSVVLILGSVFFAQQSFAQRFAYVDTKYILAHQTVIRRVIIIYIWQGHWFEWPIMCIALSIESTQCKLK